MPDVGFGGNVGSAFTGFAWVRSGGIGLPTGRAMSDGGTGAVIVGLGMYVAGNGGTRTIQLQIGSATTAGFNVGSAGHPVPFTGYVGTNAWAVNGGAADVYIYMGGTSVNFGRSSTSGASNTVGSSGTTWSGTLGGAYRYVQGPTAPGIVSVTPNADGTAATVVLSGVADNGGSGVSGYRIQRATNAGFTTGLATVDSTGTTVMTGLTPGQTYYYRATARNGVTDTFGKLGGPWSGTFTRAQPDPAGFGRRYSGTVFQTVDGKVRNPAGTAWVDLDGRRLAADGVTWQQMGT